MNRMELIDIYYNLSELLDDDIECVADAIKHFTHSEHRRSIILINLEYLRLENIESELIQILDIKKNVLIEFLVNWKIKQKKIGYQTTIFDFLWEE